MARVALGLGVRDLAGLAKVGAATISRLEAGDELLPRTVANIRAALEAAGVVFVDENGEGPGVRMSKRIVELRGRVSDLRARVEAAKARADKAVSDELDLIASRGRYSGIETEEMLRRVLDNLCDRARLIAESAPREKAGFPEIL